MIIKKGIVMKIVTNKAYLLTQEGDFVKVYLNDMKHLPSIGSEYEGRVIKKSFFNSNLFKYVAACFIFFTTILGGSAYAYYKPISTVTISINPSLELKLNRWNKVISSKGLNEDGKILLKQLTIKNENIDTVLTEIIRKAKEDKYITEKYVTEGKIITLNIDNKKLKLPNFKDEVNKEHLNLIINSSGTILFKNTAPINKQEYSDELKDSKPSVENNKNNSSSSNNSNNTPNNKKPLNSDENKPEIKNEKSKESKKEQTIKNDNSSQYNKDSNDKKDNNANKNNNDNNDNKVSNDSNGTKGSNTHNKNK